MRFAIENQFPRNPDDVTKKWISNTIGKATGNEVSDIELIQIGDEQGASALVCRAKIVWRDAGNFPRALILKFASSKAAHREYAKSMGTYLKEVRFYQSILSAASLPIPYVYFAEIDEASNHFLIVMEDLSGARMTRWFSEGVDDVEIAVTALAEIHAKYWDDEVLSTLEWLGRSDDEDQCNQYKSLLEQLLPPAKTTFGNLLSGYSWAVLDAWLASWESVRLATSKGANTLVHREADMRQMFFPTAFVDRFVLFDWQSPEIGWGAMDVCRLIATSLSLSARRQHEDSLVKMYVDQLRKNGVTGFSEDILWQQIKLSLLMNVLAHLFSLLWVETEETDVWRHEHLGVLGAALEDWKLLEVIDQLDC